MPGIGIVLTVFTRIPQIWTNYSNGHTGQLAILTWILQWGGALARVFTTMQDPGISEASRPALLAGFGIGCTLSFIIILQIVVYRSATQKKLAEVAKNKLLKRRLGFGVWGPYNYTEKESRESRFVGFEQLKVGEMRPRARI